jgi:hypothetical protein
MPSTAQITAAEPLTDEQAYRLTAIVRTATRYQDAPWAYVGLAEKITALVAVDSIASRHLSAITAALDAMKDGTIAVKGGELGADYSKDRDRQKLLNEVLDALFTGLEFESGTAFSRGGSFHLHNIPTW